MQLLSKWHQYKKHVMHKHIYFLPVLLITISLSAQTVFKRHIRSANKDTLVTTCSPQVNQGCRYVHIRCCCQASIYPSPKLLYILDGSIWEPAPNDINPDDIVDITVLNGPVAAAIYGPQAAGGAILITTKKAKKISDSIRASLPVKIAKHKADTITLPKATNAVKVSVYPNPTSGYITIESRERIDALSITDLSGKVLMRVQNSEQKNTYRIDLTLYPSGIYMIRYFLKDKGWQSVKVVVGH